MEPTLHDGDWILARRDGRAGVGDVVVLEHPQRPGMLIVKRVERVDPDGYWVVGDAPGASTDSRHFGAAPDGGGSRPVASPPLGPHPLTPRAPGSRCSQ